MNHIFEWTLNSWEFLVQEQPNLVILSTDPSSFNLKMSVTGLQKTHNRSNPRTHNYKRTMTSTMSLFTVLKRFILRWLRRDLQQPYIHISVTEFGSERHVHAHRVSTCALPDLHNTSSPVRLHQPPQSAPAHMLAVQGRIWIYLPFPGAVQVELHSLSYSRRKLKMKNRQINRAWLQDKWEMWPRRKYGSF